VKESLMVPGGGVILPCRECRICRELFRPVVPLQRICPSSECKHKNRRRNETNAYARRKAGKGRERAI
jgi:hypothetical protein